MPGDGKCLYWYLAAAQMVENGGKLQDVRYDQTAALAEVKAKIMDNCIAYNDILQSRGLSTEEIKTHWTENTGRTAEQILDDMTGHRQGKDQWGGHVEARLFGWRSTCAHDQCRRN